MDIRSTSSDGMTYRVGRQVSDNHNYRLYLCEQGETGRQCLLQVATTKEFNGELDRAAFILRLLAQSAAEVEADYAKRVGKGPKYQLNYDIAFPELVDSFICHEQGDRRINILAFRHVDDPTSMTPLILLTDEDRVRVDLRTSVWIMGKLLKLFVFLHGELICCNLVTRKNILIQPEKHYIVLFDWSQGTLEESIPTTKRRKEIALAARAVITVMGGDPEGRFIPNDGDEAHAEYSNFLFDLAQGRESDAARAHEAFYALADRYWKRAFHPFTVIPLNPEISTP